MKHLIKTLPSAICASAFLSSMAGGQPTADGKEKDSKRWEDLLPSSFVLNGREYHFDQKWLEARLIFALKSYKESLSAGSSSTGTDSFDFAKATLAYGIIAAGQYALNTKEMVSFLQEAEQALGKEALPPGISSPVTQMAGIASISFRDKQEDGIDVDIVHLGPRDFGSIIQIAKMQIENRSKGKTSDQK